MGIFFIGIVLFGGGLLLGWWYDNKYTGRREWPVVLGISGILIGAVSILVCICGLIGTSINNETMTQDLIEQKTMIEYRLDRQEDEDNLVVNGGLYNDICEYNSTIRQYHRYGKSFWLNWFYEDGPCKLELIELPNEMP